jgi:gluconolactonase
VYFTDPKWGAGPDDIQGVYVFSRDGVTTLAARLDRQPNGIVISPDGQWVFVSRSGARDIWKFRLESGSRRLVEGRQWATVESEPDGITIDRDGNVYATLAGNGKLCVLSPDGAVKHLVPIVERMATNCEFQGDNESILYVTCGGKKEEKTAAIYRVRFP